MIQRKPANRLGYNGSQELKNHPWYRNYPWAKLAKKELKAPFTPNVFLISITLKSKMRTISISVRFSMKTRTMLNSSTRTTCS